MKRINVLHVSRIDNNMSKGTSVVIPEYILSQNKFSNVGLLNCNNLKLSKLDNISNVFMLSDNKNMRVLKQFKPDIVVFHEVYKPYYLKIFKHCISNDIPYIIIPHGCITKTAQNHKKLKKMLGNFMFFNKFLRLSSTIQYLSLNEANNTAFPNLKYYIIGNGIDNIPTINRYSTFGHAKKCLNFVYVGRYDYYIKGLDQLLKSFTFAKINNLNIHLNLYGSGSKSDEYLIRKYISNNNIDDYVSLNGPIFGEEKRKALIKNDIFVQTSRTEGQPLGVAEALCLGMPVILSVGTGFSDVINNYKIGYLVNTDCNDIYDKIIDACNNTNKLDEMSKNAYEFSKREYLWDDISLKSIKIYKNIIFNK